MQHKFVFQQQSTGLVLMRKTEKREYPFFYSGLSLHVWQKHMCKNILKNQELAEWHSIITQGDVIVSWYGPDYDSFMRKRNVTNRETECDRVFRSYEKQMSTKELIVLLKQISATHALLPALEVKVCICK